MRRQHLLIVGAFEAELAPLRTLLQDRKQVTIDAIGIGLVEAAIGASRAIERLKSTTKEALAVLFVGSIGTTNRSVELLSFVGASEAVLVDYVTETKQGYFPEGIVRRIKADEDLLKSFSGRDNVTIEPVYSTVSITASEKTGELLSAKTESHFESLELFSVANVCFREGIPWTGLCAVTNYVGPTGHAEWQQNHGTAAERTARLVAQIL